ncbi:ABC transporter [Crepidotus variabilis]|uniref:ABC transporter n=1 Tax=Crepidotus variabilis TaxID=179855 RepID=A0A9P6EGF5_9AGAR|nr:ABC transporter [Crepidotus variabilis]
MDPADLSEKAKSNVYNGGAIQRAWWQRVPFAPTTPTPSPQSLDDAPLIPEVSANPLSLITFGWLSPILGLGYTRPLQAEDLWRLQEDRGAKEISQKIVDSWDRRVAQANEWNARLERGEVRGKRKDPSLVWACNDAVKYWFWSAGILKVISDGATITSPLVVKAIIDFATESYIAHLQSLPGPPIGKGIGLTFTLFALLLISSIAGHHYFYRAMSTGILLRSGLITAIYNRSLILTTRARSGAFGLSAGKLTNHIAVDVSRIDLCAWFVHNVWTSPIQLLVCLALLIVNLGYKSALAGFAVFILAFPIQIGVMKKTFAVRRAGMGWSDKRVRAVQEALSGMRVIKVFGWEGAVGKKVKGLRVVEVGYTRTMWIIRSINNAIALNIPTVASVIGFVTYFLTEKNLDPGVIFTAFTLFNLLRMPLMFLPMSIGALAEGKNAMQRLKVVFEAEVMPSSGSTTSPSSYTIDSKLPYALKVSSATFAWDAPPPDPEEERLAFKKLKEAALGGPPAMGPGGGGGRPQKNPNAEREAEELKKKAELEKEQAFKVQDINMTIARGSLVAIVGSVGSGKSSLISGLIGEGGRLTTGTVQWGGPIAYCPQVPWIMNTSIKSNILFGLPYRPEEYTRAVRTSALLQDLKMWDRGDETEVGERGIALSGGQKGRVGVARAVYSALVSGEGREAKQVLVFDDPLSALDAGVGRRVFWDVLRRGWDDKDEKVTRILVTHALHFLRHVDYIYVMEDGRIKDEGTYDVLVTREGDFGKMLKEVGRGEEDDQYEGHNDVDMVDAKSTKDQDEDQDQEKTPMMQAEERTTGAVSLSTYLAYLAAGKGRIIAPVTVFLIVLMQAALVLGSYWLVWWGEMKWGKSEGFYMGVYAGLGVIQMLFTFAVGCSFALFNYFAAQRLHEDALNRLLHAPMSFFDTTPLGRIMNRFSKDIDSVDNLLGDSIRMFLVTLAYIFGAIVLISIVLPWFLIAVFAILILYVYAAAFYRASAREFKRLDSILRSSVYTHFSETLTGLSTIRAYGETERFKTLNERHLDIENRAYWMTVVNQRWLGFRLDFLGALLTFAVAMMAVGTRYSISPAQTGVVLSYILNVQQLFGMMVRQLAEVENNMNAAERIVHYSRDIEQEAAHEVPEMKPPPQWPAQGRVELEDVVMNYRPGLPVVLKGISLSVGGGEKVGIVGRTGAGKSSVMNALFRINEILSGSMRIDDVDITKIGLSDLRKTLAIIPQDPLLFSGTLRSNLDPFGDHDDATLYDALKRVYLADTLKNDTDEKVENEINENTSTPISRGFTLDSAVDDEGSNFSVGQRSLVSLARALVKNSKIIVMDEATASVDYETDRKIQETIARQFADRTILCIAHRLRTIISYDRICVLDAGRVAEFDTPETLFRKPSSIFREMCNRSSITLEDIIAARRWTVVNKE